MKVKKARGKREKKVKNNFFRTALAFFAAICILGLIALIFDAARKEKEDELHVKEKERTV